MTTQALEDAAPLTWTAVWTRAVVVPAARRATAAWIGSAIVGGVIFGPTGMRPSDLTGLAFHHPGVAGVLAVTWLLVFVPTARVLLRADGAAYLRSLPGPTLAPVGLTIAALVGLQLPWLALWVAGEGARGLGVVTIMTMPIVLVACWRPPPARAGWPSWRRDSVALRAIHLRALRRRAGDALVRGAGLAVLAGMAAGLIVRNNQLVDANAAAVAAAVIAVVLVPAQVGLLLVLLESHRATSWLTDTLGVRRATRIGALLYALAAVHLAAATIAIIAAAVIAGASGSTIAWIAATTLAIAGSSALGTARVLLDSESSPTVAARIVIGAVVIAAAAVLCLGVLGIAGSAAFAAAGLLALVTVRT